MVKTCAYCGNPASDKEHIIPRCLYPESKKGSKVQRITVSACRNCNLGWSDDEALFRTILVMAGEITPVAQELWDGSVSRSFAEKDAGRRLHQILQHLHSGDGGTHTMNPADVEAVRRVVRKIVRGLCVHHKLSGPIPDELVWVDVLKYEVPPLIYDAMESAHVESDIVEYRFDHIGEDEGFHSFWLLKFLRRTSFIALVYTSAHAREQAEIEYVRQAENRGPAPYRKLP